MQEKYEKNKKNLQKALAKIVKKYRKQKGKSITLISAEIGMTKSIWGDLEREQKDPQLSTIWRVAEALDIPLSVLIAEIESCLKSDFSLTLQ